MSTTRKEVQKEIVKKHNDLRRSVSPPARNMLKMVRGGHIGKWLEPVVIMTVPY